MRPSKGARTLLGSRWDGDQFAKFLNGAAGAKHLVEAMRFRFGSTVMEGFFAHEASGRLKAYARVVRSGPQNRTGLFNHEEQDLSGASHLKLESSAFRVQLTKQRGNRVHLRPTIGSSERFFVPKAQ